MSFIIFFKKITMTLDSLSRESILLAVWFQIHIFSESSSIDFRALPVYQAHVV